MEFTARLKYLQKSPQKVRLVADQIRGSDVQDAANLLALSRKAAARPLAKLLRSAIANAGVFLELQSEFGSFDEYIWRFVGGATKVNRWRRLAELPAKTAESEAMSRDLKARGMNFVGPTICYAYMQAAGMVNDHLVSCFRYAELTGR